MPIITGKACSNVLPETGQWLLRDTNYELWQRESVSSLRWLHGMPGSGKSKLVSTVVEEALQHYSIYAAYSYIRPQTKENSASRPLCQRQALDRSISSWVGDHQRILTVVCFCIFSVSFRGGGRAFSPLL